VYYYYDDANNNRVTTKTKLKSMTAVEEKPESKPKIGRRRRNAVFFFHTPVIDVFRFKVTRTVITDLKNAEAF